MAPLKQPNDALTEDLFRFVGHVNTIRQRIELFGRQFFTPIDFDLGQQIESLTFSGSEKRALLINSYREICVEIDNKCDEIKPIQQIFDRFYALVTTRQLSEEKIAKAHNLIKNELKAINVHIANLYKYFNEEEMKTLHGQRVTFDYAYRILRHLSQYSKRIRSEKREIKHPDRFDKLFNLAEDWCVACVNIMNEILTKPDGTIGNFMWTVDNVQRQIESMSKTFTEITTNYDGSKLLSRGFLNRQLLERRKKEEEAAKKGQSSHHE